MVKELLDAVWLAGADKIKNAYSEGYKAGLLAAYPDEAYWRELASGMKSAAAAPGWGAVLGASAGAIILGFSAGVITCAGFLAK